MITQRAYSAAVGTLGRVQRLRHPAPIHRLESKAACIEIGLINNMPDAALDATVRQFRGLLGAAAGDMAIHLTLYTLPEVPRSDFGRHQVSGYADINHLWDSHLDGLIVTGAEPRAADLEDEPYWNSLTRVLDWAERHT